MRIGVTGATGFVGGHVIRALLQNRDIQILATARSSEAAARLPAGVKVVQVDLASPSDTAIERLAAVDTLIHLSWGGLPHYLSTHHFDIELPLQYRFLKRLVSAGLPALFVTGTCYEYGMIDGSLSEDRQCWPDNPYGFAKASLLRQLSFLQRETPFALGWARLFYMYGEGQAPTSLYSQLNAALARGDASFPMSGGQQLRDFLPISEVARRIVALALKRADLGIVNICSGRPIAIRSLVEQWMSEAGKAMQLDLGRYPYSSYEPFAFWGSADKCEALLSSGTSR